MEPVHAELTIRIARPPDDVFAYLSDVANLTEWQSGVHSAEIQGGGAATVGARVVESRTMLGKEMTTTLEIVDFDRLGCSRCGRSTVRRCSPSATSSSRAAARPSCESSSRAR